MADNDPLANNRLPGCIVPEPVLSWPMVLSARAPLIGRAHLSGRGRSCAGGATALRLDSSRKDAVILTVISRIHLLGRAVDYLDHVQFDAWKVSGDDVTEFLIASRSRPGQDIGTEVLGVATFLGKMTMCPEL